LLLLHLSLDMFYSVALLDQRIINLGHRLRQATGYVRSQATSGHRLRQVTGYVRSQVTSGHRLRLMADHVNSQVRQGHRLCIPTIRLQAACAHNQVTGCVYSPSGHDRLWGFTIKIRSQAAYVIQITTDRHHCGPDHTYSKALFTHNAALYLDTMWHSSAAQCDTGQR
jgi:hypothetical protein